MFLSPIDISLSAVSVNILVELTGLLPILFCIADSFRFLTTGFLPSISILVVALAESSNFSGLLVGSGLRNLSTISCLLLLPKLLSQTSPFDAPIFLANFIMLSISAALGSAFCRLSCSAGFQ